MSYRRFFMVACDWAQRQSHRFRPCAGTKIAQKRSGYWVSISVVPRKQNLLRYNPGRYLMLGRLSKSMDGTCPSILTTYLSFPISVNLSGSHTIDLTAGTSFLQSLVSLSNNEALVSDSSLIQHPNFVIIEPPDRIINHQTKQQRAMRCPALRQRSHPRQLRQCLEEDRANHEMDDLCRTRQDDGKLHSPPVPIFKW